jgi:cytochrome c biogenesis protein CcdA
VSLIQQPLLIGAWIGLIHAFDADHISTLSSLTVHDRQRSAFGYAARWACGHAVAIVALGTLALGLGILWISSLSRVAELAVAFLLIALGANTAVATCRRMTAAAAHAGGDRPGRGHAAGLLMGLLHGGAGSAAVLAILPLAGFDSSLAALGFLVMFSVGVAVGALLFAAVFARLVVRAVHIGERVADAFAIAVGLVAILVGGSMLLGTLDAG